jgi:hypothetical protein
MITARVVRVNAAGFAALDGTPLADATRRELVAALEAAGNVADAGALQKRPAKVLSVTLGGALYAVALNLEG